LLAGLEPGSLVLFDLGCFAFWWFDELSQRGYHWVSRLREKTSYHLVHVFWRFEGNIDALIWLGAHRADRAGKLVRLVRVWDGEQVHSYISNVLDPHVLSLKEIVQLYGRRWDVELAFLLLKEYLGLHQWWSSQPVLVEQQCLAVIVVGQLVQHLRMQMAVQAGVDAFEVSLPLLLEVLPELLQEKQEPLEWMRTYGREVGLIRPSSRGSLTVPQVKEPLLLPAAGITQQRTARYHSYGQEPQTGCVQVTASKTATAKKREKKKEESTLKAVKEAKREEKSRKSKRAGDKEKKKGLQGARKKGLPQFSG
jgi:Transposase DDE domain